MQTMMMLMLAGLLAFSPSALSATQEGDGTQKTQESKTTTPPEAHIRVFRLKHANCKNIAKLLGRMPLRVSAQADTATNSVICMGTEENLRLCEELIGKLDIAVKDAKLAEPLKSKTVIRTFRLKNASCGDVASAIKNLVTNKIWAELRTNSVIYVGPEYNLETVQKLIEELDSVQTGTQLEREVVVVPVKHRSVDDVASKIREAFPSGLMSENNVQVSVDRAGSSLLLRGSKTIVTMSKATIRQLDTPAAVRNLEFAFLKAESGDTQPGSAIPDDLKDVANELKRFGRIELLGRLSTMAVEGKPFVISGEKGDMSHWIKGRLLHASEDGDVKIEVEAQLSQYLGHSGGGSGRRAYNTVFKLETSVLTRSGDYVVLGSAPGQDTGKPSESVILVLHVPS